MDSIYQLHPEKFYRFHLDYTTAAYYRAMGNWDKQYWKQALDIYSKLQAEYSGNKRSTYYRWTSLEKIYLCKIQGMAMEACRIYQELYPPIDTLASQSYIRQINTIKAKYQVDKAETASNNEYNKIINQHIGRNDGISNVICSTCHPTQKATGKGETLHPKTGNITDKCRKCHACKKRVPLEHEP